MVQASPASEQISAPESGMQHTSRCFHLPNLSAAFFLFAGESLPKYRVQNSLATLLRGMLGVPFLVPSPAKSIFCCPFFLVLFVRRLDLVFAKGRMIKLEFTVVIISYSFSARPRPIGNLSTHAKVQAYTHNTYLWIDRGGDTHGLATHN